MDELMEVLAEIDGLLAEILIRKVSVLDAGQRLMLEEAHRRIGQVEKELMQ